MVFYLAILLIITCAGIKVYGPGAFNDNYLDKKHTAAINGIFVILVVFSHFSGYAHLGGSFDAPYLYLKNHLHQMVVATFLFYSGYGMMEQIRKRGFTYVKGIPKRAGRLLFRFDAAVLLFLLMNTLRGRTYSFSRIIFSMLGWKSVGNSNWYIFDILVLYVLMFAAFFIAEKLSPVRRTDSGTELITESSAGMDRRNANADNSIGNADRSNANADNSIGNADRSNANADNSIGNADRDNNSAASYSIHLAEKHRNLAGLILLTLLTLIFIYIMMHAGKGRRWYNTVILFPAGCFFSEFRTGIEQIIRKSDISYFISLFIMSAVYCFAYVNRKSHGIEGYTIWALAFIAMVVLITMKVEIRSSVLQWLGKHVFSIYMLQRIPMLILDRYGLIDEHKYLCLIAVFALTIPLALIFEKATELMLNIPAKIASKKKLHSKI